MRADARVRDTMVDVPGGTVFVREWTPETASTAAPVVMLHDSLGCVELWRDFPEALASTLRRPVIAYDRLGFGKSTALEELPSRTFIADEAGVFFPVIRDALGIANFALFGHSVGGAMALMIAASSDTRCDAVITESAQAFVEERTLEGIRAAEEEFRDVDQFQKLVRRHGDKAKWVLEAWTRTWLSPTFASWRLEPHLGKIQCPVLAIHGELDEYGSVEFPRRIAGGVSGRAELAILSGCGHVPHREEPNTVLQLVSNFMT